MTSPKPNETVSEEVLKNREHCRRYYAANVERLREAAMQRYYQRKNDPDRVKPPPKKRGRPRKYPSPEPSASGCEN